jgi:hypothetical protein
MKEPKWSEGIPLAKNLRGGRDHSRSQGGAAPILNPNPSLERMEKTNAIAQMFLNSVLKAGFPGVKSNPAKKWP